MIVLSASLRHSLALQCCQKSKSWTPSNRKCKQSSLAEKRVLLLIPSPNPFHLAITASATISICIPGTAKDATPMVIHTGLCPGTLRRQISIICGSKPTSRR